MPRTRIRTVDPTATLAKQRATLLAKQAQIRAKLAENEATQRTRDRQARLARHVQVGKLADDAGLLGYELGILEKAFTQLAVELAERVSLPASTPPALTSSSPVRLHIPSAQE